MGPNHILRFTRSDDTNAFVLVQAAPAGPRLLDLKLVGTEGEAPYIASLRHDRVSALMVKNSCTEAEWEAILTSLLQNEPVDDVEAVGLVRSETSITIAIRKHVQGITQRLGAITLTHKEDEAIELFDWCGLAVQAAARNRESLSSNSAKVQELSQTVDELRTQLSELIQAKEDDEAELLEKFRDLLNEKKVKIRQQQRIIASAASNGNPMARSQPSQPSQPSLAAQRPERTHAPRPSRASKRKAAAAVEDQSDSDDGFERMDAVEDSGKAAVAEVGSDAETNQQTTEDEATASGAEDEAEMPAEAVPARSAGGTRMHQPPAGNTRQQTAVAKNEEPPPKRDLPFANKKAAKPSLAQAAPVGSDTESDDEL